MRSLLTSLSVSLLVSLSVFAADVPTPMFDDCNELLMKDVVKYYRESIKPQIRFEAKVDLTEERALKRVVESIPPDAYIRVNDVISLKPEWLERLTEVQRKTIQDYLSVISGRAKTLRFLNRETVVIKEFVDHLLSKEVHFAINENEIIFDLAGVDLNALGHTQLKNLFEFQKLLNEVEKNPIEYKKLFDTFTGRLDVAKASLGMRRKLIANNYKGLFALHAYKNKVTGEPSIGWTMKNLDDSEFVIPGGTRRSFRSSYGIVILENHNAKGVLESVEVIIERDLNDPTRGVAFFAYNMSKEGKGDLTDVNMIFFRGKVSESKVNTTNGCISCHKLMGKEFVKSASTVHPFTARTVIHKSIADDMAPSSKKLQELLAGEAVAE